MINLWDLPFQDDDPDPDDREVKQLVLKLSSKPKRVRRVRAGTVPAMDLMKVAAEMKAAASTKK